MSKGAEQNVLVFALVSGFSGNVREWTLSCGFMWGGVVPKWGGCANGNINGADFWSLQRGSIVEQLFYQCKLIRRLSFAHLPAVIKHHGHSGTGPSRQP